MNGWSRNRVLAMVAVALAAAAAGLGASRVVNAQCCAPASKVAANEKSTAGDSLLVLDISGMTCEGCAAHVSKALSGVKGVKEAKVSLASKEAKVRLARPTAQEKGLVEAVKKSGYGAKVKGKAPADGQASSQPVKSSAS